MPDRAPTSAAQDAANSTYPLSQFYAHAKLALPRIEIIPGGAVPEPYRALLVHANDMTPTLEAFHQSDIHLEVLARERRGDFYYRQVVSRLNRDEQPVEFGAEKIYVARFPEEARDLILEENVPLTRILKDGSVRHCTEARAFLRVESDDLINRALGLEQPVTLYGRKAVVSDKQGRPLSEIVDILRPQAA